MQRGEKWLSMFSKAGYYKIGETSKSMVQFMLLITIVMLFKGR